MQCHPLAMVGHRQKCDKNHPIHKMWNDTHSLLVIGKHVMRLHFKNVQCYSLPVGRRKRYDEAPFPKICNITHFLLVIGRDCLSQNVQCHSLSVGHMKRCDEIPFLKMSNAIHILSVREKS